MIFEWLRPVYAIDEFPDDDQLWRNTNKGAEISSDADLGFISVSAALLCRCILRRNGVSRVGSVPSSAVVPKSLPKGAFG
jgi:hypothetical protein